MFGFSLFASKKAKFQQIVLQATCSVSSSDPASAGVSKKPVELLPLMVDNEEELHQVLKEQVLIGAKVFKEKILTLRLWRWLLQNGTEKLRSLFASDLEISKGIKAIGNHSLIKASLEMLALLSKIDSSMSLVKEQINILVSAPPRVSSINTCSLKSNSVVNPSTDSATCTPVVNPSPDSATCTPVVESILEKITAHCSACIQAVDMFQKVLYGNEGYLGNNDLARELYNNLVDLAHENDKWIEKSKNNQHAMGMLLLCDQKITRSFRLLESMNGSEGLVSSDAGVGSDKDSVSSWQTTSGQQQHRKPVVIYQKEREDVHSLPTPIVSPHLKCNDILESIVPSIQEEGEEYIVHQVSESTLLQETDSKDYSCIPMNRQESELQLEADSVSLVGSVTSSSCSFTSPTKQSQGLLPNLMTTSILDQVCVFDIQDICAQVSSKSVNNAAPAREVLNGDGLMLHGKEGRRVSSSSSLTMPSKRLFYFKEPKKEWKDISTLDATMTRQFQAMHTSYEELQQSCGKDDQDIEMDFKHEELMDEYIGYATTVHDLTQFTLTFYSCSTQDYSFADQCLVRRVEWSMNKLEALKGVLRRLIGKGRLDNDSLLMNVAEIHTEFTTELVGCLKAIQLFQQH